MHANDKVAEDLIFHVDQSECTNFSVPNASKIVFDQLYMSDAVQDEVMYLWLWKLS